MRRGNGAKELHMAKEGPDGSVERRSGSWPHTGSGLEQNTPAVGFSKSPYLTTPRAAEGAAPLARSRGGPINLKSTEIPNFCFLSASICA